MRFFRHNPRVVGLRRAILILVAAVALALPAGAWAGGFSAHLYAPNHQPKVGNWRIKVTARRGGQKLSGTVSYRFLYAGQVVKTEPGGRSSMASSTTR